MTSLLLLACVGEDTGSFRHMRLPQTTQPSHETGVPADTSGADTNAQDSDPADTSPVDTSPADTSETDTGSGTIESCYLGPSRDHSVCLPTVPYDAATFGSDYDYPEPYGGSAQYAAPTRYLDLDAVDADLQLAPNFQLSEYAASYKGRWAVVQDHVMDELQAIRDDIGEPLTVNSGYRSPSYNAGVGGVEYSRHQYGDAADLESSSYSVEELGDVCTSEGADYVGLYEDGHTHCDWRDHTLDDAFYGDAAGPPAPTELTGRLSCTRAGCAAAAQGFDEGEPFRRWWALDARGNVLTTATGRTFQPPEGTTRVRVRIGGRVELEAAAGG